MNFYMGNSVDEIDGQDNNVEFSDELIDFIYKLRRRASVDMHKLYEINPYADVEISKNDLQEIIEICEYILETELLHAYEEPYQGNLMLQDLVEIAQKAISNNLGLVSIGD